MSIMLSAGPEGASPGVGAIDAAWSPAPLVALVPLLPLLLARSTDDAPDGLRVSDSVGIYMKK